MALKRCVTDDGFGVLAARGHVELLAGSQSEVERVFILTQMIVDLDAFKIKGGRSHTDFLCIHIKAVLCRKSSKKGGG